MTLTEKCANNDSRVLSKGGDLIMDIKMLVGWVVVVGAINWGLVGLLNLNVVEMIFGAGSMLTKIVYILVGLSGAFAAYTMLGGKKK